MRPSVLGAVAGFTHVLVRTARRRRGPLADGVLPAIYLNRQVLASHTSGARAHGIRHRSRVRPSDHDLAIEVAFVPFLGLTPFEAFV